MVVTWWIVARLRSVRFNMLMLWVLTSLRNIDMYCLVMTPVTVFLSVYLLPCLLFKVFMFNLNIGLFLF